MKRARNNIFLKKKLAPDRSAAASMYSGENRVFTEFSTATCNSLLQYIKIDWSARMEINDGELDKDCEIDRLCGKTLDWLS